MKFTDRARTMRYLLVLMIFLIAAVYFLGDTLHPNGLFQPQQALPPDWANMPPRGVGGYGQNANQPISADARSYDANPANYGYPSTGQYLTRVTQASYDLTNPALMQAASPVHPLDTFLRGY